MSEHYDFHYQPTGSGAISGQQVLEQTEDAINELGDYVNDNVGGAMDVAQQALETAQNAEQDAQTALDTANSFSDAIQSAQQDASTALSTAQTAQTTASNANNTAIQASQDASSAVTTANNASGQVSTLSGTVTALGQRVTTAEGNIGQNASDITALGQRVTTAEGNITTLQNDVSIAQGNASSAMATAGQVKQQAFVFRYSSTALVASSTNSNTLLDNTDNLKVGDKVIDSSGVLFSVTAIDTQNSTFTIGTALIDLAQDSDVVHKSGNETVAGVKTFSDNPVIGSNNANITVSNRQITANSSYSTPTGNSYSYIQLKAMVNYADSSPSIDATVGLSVQENAYSDGKNRSFSPSSNNLINLGLPDRHWANVYAINYYYGSNNIEFSTKFVTTDTAQTISGTKTFLDIPISLKSSTAELGVTGGNTKVIFTDKNLLNLAGITFGNYGSSKLSYCRFHIYDKDSNNQEIENFIEFSYVNNNQTAYFRPNKSNFVTLGAVNNRWSKVYADEYYYGSNNVEFSTKFVTTDTNQTITGAKTFSSNVNVYNSDSATDIAHLVLKNQKAEKGGSSSDSQIIYFTDKLTRALAAIRSSVGIDGQSMLVLRVDNIDSNNNAVYSGFSISSYKNGTKNIAPNTNGDTDFGTENAKWKSFNGVEPSSLSLPSGNASDVIDISSYITALDGTSNSYTVPANGWISIAITGTAISIVSSSWSDSRLRESSGNVRMLYPVLKNETLGISVIGTTLDYARFIPCQGNV